MVAIAGLLAACLATSPVPPADATAIALDAGGAPYRAGLQPLSSRALDEQAAASIRISASSYPALLGGFPASMSVFIDAAGNEMMGAAGSGIAVTSSNTGGSSAVVQARFTLSAAVAFSGLR